jgi:WD40 repeat protein/tRNA A-37 threonylcarbamoyl transferase component Bud32
MSAPRSSVLERIDQLCDRYENARLAGQRPQIDDYLREVPEAERPVLLRELLRLERAYLQDDQRRRWQQGERVLVQAYLEETPWLSDYPELVFELVCGEVLLREERGEKPRLVDYLELVPTHQAPLRRLFVSRRLLPPETLQGPSEPATLRASHQVTVVEPNHTVDELPPSADETATALPAPQQPASHGEAVLAPPGYEVLGKLGHGGMGVVYKARQLKADRLVALKMILAGGHADTDQLARFRTEAEAIARLQHPHVVQVFEVGEHNGLPFFSLEFCPGGSLDKKLAGTPLPPKEAATLVEKLARGVQAAHEAQVLHRDLKPANVLLATDGTPKVTDFGLAKKLDARGVTIPGVIMGTPSYMAPEQASGAAQELGPAVDVYALGAILYECLTGRPPFKAATVLDTLRQVVSEEPVPPRQLNAQVPRDLETVCLKCLHKEAAKRYASAAGLADEMGRFLRGEPILARPVGRLERGVKWVRRNPVVAGLTATVAAVLLASSLVSWGLAAWALGEKGRADEQADKALEQKGRAAGQASRADHKAEEAKKSAQQEQEARTRVAQAFRAWQQNDMAEAERILDQLDPRLRHTQASRAGNALHAIQMAQAFRAWQQNDMAEAERILDQVDPRLRHTWETRHLLEICRRKALPFPEPRRLNPVTFVGISGDGKRIVTSEGTVWDAESGQKIWTLNHLGAPSVAISNDGKRIVSGLSHDTIRVWDAESGGEIRTLKGNTENLSPSSVAISGDGKRIVSGSDDNVARGTVRVWDAESGREICTLKEHRAWIRVAISHDGKRIVSSCSGIVNRTVWLGGLNRVWDAESGQEICTLKEPTGEPARAQSLAISRDGKQIVSANQDKTVRVWDTESGREIRTLKAPMMSQWRAFCVAISVDGKRIISGGGDGTIRVWDAETGVEILTLKGHMGYVSSVAVSNDGKRIVSGGYSENFAKALMVWNPECSREKLTLKGHTGNAPSPGGVRSVAVSSDGKRIASESENGTVRVWDAESGREIRTLKGNTENLSLYNSVAISGDGKRIVRIVSKSRDGQVNPVSATVWDAENGREIRTLKGPMWENRTLMVGPSSGVMNFVSVAISSDGKWIISGGDSGEVMVWDAESGRAIRTLKGPSGRVAISRNGKRIVSSGIVSSGSTMVSVWDAESGLEKLTLRVVDKERLYAHEVNVVGVAISHDGNRIVLGRQGGTVKVWDVESCQEICTFKGHTGSLAPIEYDSSRRIVSSVAISGDGKRIISGGDDGTVRVWDADTGVEKLTLKGHTGPVTSVAISGDGKRIISGGDDGTVRVWDAVSD